MEIEIDSIEDAVESCEELDEMYERADEDTKDRINWIVRKDGLVKAQRKLNDPTVGPLEKRDLHLVVRVYDQFLQQHGTEDDMVTYT